MMISVCLTTYNSERFLERQLESILSQLSPEDEVVVSDDGSTDRTMEIIARINSPLIRVVRNQGERGYTSNFEHALTQVRGDVVFLSDHDDVWMPNKVERCLELLQTNDFVIHDATLIDEHERQINPSFFALRRPRRTLLGNWVKFGYLGCCLAFRRSVLEKALPFPQHRKWCTHDNWLTLVGMAFYSVEITDEKLIAYRRHSENFSFGEKDSHRSLVFRLTYRTYLLWQLLKRLT